MISCRNEESSTATTVVTGRSANQSNADLWDSTKTNLPVYLLEWNGLYDRDSIGNIINAHEDDTRLAKSYPWWIDKGPLTNQMCFTIMVSKLHFNLKERVRIVHVMEDQKPGRYVHVMGPKEIKGEYINDSLATKKSPENAEPWIPEIYDGLILKGPLVDYHFEISTYSFSRSGTYKIQWHMGKYASNILLITVE